MRPFVAAAVLTLIGCTEALCRQLAFTSMNLIACPVTISSFMESKAWGFDSIVLRNDAPLAVTAVYLRVAVRTPEGDEVTEDRRVDVQLLPHDTKRVNGDLGHVDGLRARARSAHKDKLLAILSVKLVEFEDHTSWQPAGSDEGTPAIDFTPPALPRLETK